MENLNDVLLGILMEGRRDNGFLRIEEVLKG
jgi:uncharacterized protein YabN with tetrapyrrole methylase and pyrophosphatase domain